MGLDLESGDIGHDCHTLNVALIIKVFITDEMILLKELRILTYFSIATEFLYRIAKFSSVTGSICHFGCNSTTLDLKS
jgi:hypothetical protein